MATLFPLLPVTRDEAYERHNRRVSKTVLGRMWKPEGGRIPDGSLAELEAHIRTGSFPTVVLTAVMEYVKKKQSIIMPKKIARKFLGPDLDRCLVLDKYTSDHPRDNFWRAIFGLLFPHVLTPLHNTLEHYL